MGDPLGVAGSAVGIVSLGLQLCQGLITYIQAFKGQKEEIEESIQEVQRVESLLTNLEKLLPEVDLRRCKQSLQNNLVSCYKQLQKLQTFLEALDPPHQSTGASRTVLNTTRSLTYPFQQTKLNSFHQSLRTYLGDLKLAIETVSLYRVLNLFFFLLYILLIKVRELNITINQKLQLISQEVATNASNQSDQLEALRAQEQQNSDSLTSTVSSAHEFNKGQFRQTQFLVRDNDQKLSGRLTVMDTRLGSIADTVARLEEMMQTTSSHSESSITMV